MKRSSRALLVLTILISTQNLPAIAAVKAGSTCSKSGKTAFSNGIEYSCVKSGKKLVWKKNAAVAQTAASRVPASPAPASPAPDVVPERSISKIDFGSLESNFSNISFTAWKKSQDKIQSTSNLQMPFELILGEHTQLNNKNPEVAISQINKLFSGAVLPKKVVLIAFSFADREWAAAKMNELVPEAVSAWVKDVACPASNSCIGGGSFHNKTNGAAVIVIATGVDPNNVDNAYSGTLEAHEYTHSIEQSSSNAFRPAVNLLQSPWPPNWYWEGLAQFAQHAAIYSDSYNNYEKFKRASAGEIFRKPTLDAKYIEEYFQTNLTPEWGAKYPRWRQYDLGAMFVEVLVSINGPDAAMRVFNESVNGSGFESAFQKVYGVTFQSVLPEISRTIALELSA